MNHKKSTLTVVKWLPFLTAVMMCLHCGTLLLGFDLYIAELLTIIGGFSIVYFISKSCGFCFLHRLGIYYTYIVMCCVWWQRTIGFGDSLTTMRIIMLLVGLIYISYVSYLRLRKKI